MSFRKPPPRRDRSDEFKDYVPRPRTPAPGGLLAGLGDAVVQPQYKRSIKAEREHMGRVAALGCLLCGAPAEVHHLREGQGMAQRASNWLTIPLCPYHHRGPRGVHGDRSALRAAKVTELDLLARVIERLTA